MVSYLQASGLSGAAELVLERGFEAFLLLAVLALSFVLYKSWRDLVKDRDWWRSIAMRSLQAGEAVGDAATNGDNGGDAE